MHTCDREQHASHHSNASRLEPHNKKSKKQGPTAAKRVDERFIFLTPDALSTAKKHSDGAVHIKRSSMIRRMGSVGHVIPVLVTIFFLTLNGAKKYWEDPGDSAQLSRLNGFQFSAKIHEYMIATSLSVIILRQVHHGLIGQGVPFGLLTSPHQLSSLSYYVSSEFWKSMLVLARTKPLLGLLVIASTIMVGLAGPSSAIIMIPTLDWWNIPTAYTNGTDSVYMHSSVAHLWPTTITKDLIPPFEAAGEVKCYSTNAQLWGWCPATDWHLVYGWANNYQTRQLKPNVTVVQDASEVRYLTSVADPELGQSIGWSVSSVVGMKPARDLMSAWSYANSNGRKLLDGIGRPRIVPSFEGGSRIKKPVVQVECTAHYGNRSDAVFPHRYFRGTPLAQYYNEIWPVPTIKMTKPPGLTFFSWVDTSDFNGSPSLGAVFEIVTYNQTVAPVTIPCAIDAYWAPVDIWLDPTVDSVIQQDSPDPLVLTSNSSDLSMHERISIDVEWAKALNVYGDTQKGPNGTAYNLTIIEKLIQSFGYPSNDTLHHSAHIISPPGDDLDLIPWCISTALGMYIADALSTIHAVDVPSYVYHRSADSPPSPPKDLENFDWTSDDFKDYPNDTDFSTWVSQQTDWTHVEYRTLRYGYGWGTKAITFILSAVILSLAGVMAVTQMVWDLVFPPVVDGPGSMGELLYLSVNSPPAKDSGTGTGAESSWIWARNVRIVSVNGEERLHFSACGPAGR